MKSPRMPTPSKVDAYEDIDEIIYTMKDEFVDNFEIFKIMLKDVKKLLYPIGQKLLSCLH